MTSVGLNCPEFGAATFGNGLTLSRAPYLQPYDFVIKYRVKILSALRLVAILEGGKQPSLSTKRIVFTYRVFIAEYKMHLIHCDVNNILGLSQMNPREALTIQYIFVLTEYGGLELWRKIKESKWGSLIFFMPLSSLKQCQRFL